LDSYSKQVDFFDSKAQELYHFINENREMLIDIIEFDKIKNVIWEYKNLISILNIFKEEMPWANQIFSSNEYNQFVSRLRDFTQSINWVIKVENLYYQISNFLNWLKLKKLESSSDSSNIELINKLNKIDFKKINDAEKVADSLIEKKEINQEEEITKHYGYFEEKWDTYKSIDKWKGKFIFKLPIWRIWWLISSVVSWLLTLWYIVYSISWETQLSIWDAIIRISVLMIWFYFVMFFSNQYSRYIKLQDFYENKAVSLKVMIWLSHISTKEEKELIYEKALDKIFSEPLFDSNQNNNTKDTINLIKETFPTKVQTSIKD